VFYEAISTHGEKMLDGQKFASDTEVQSVSVVRQWLGSSQHRSLACIRHSETW